MNLPTFKDERGKLTVIEDCPFEIKRVFWIYGVPEGKERARHSHDLCEQILICVNGSVIVEIDEIIMVLNSSDKSLYIPTYTMISLYNFSPDAVLLVLASEVYDKNDNIQST